MNASSNSSYETLKQVKKMELKWRFRLAELRDLPRLEEIETSSFRRGVQESREILEERIRVFPQGFVVASEKATDQPIGYISSEIWRNNIEPNRGNLCVEHSIREMHDVSGAKLYISSIAILPSYRGLGLGETLLRYLLEGINRQYPSLEQALLVVCEDWDNARRLYQRCGFIERSHMEDLYHPEESMPRSGIVMVRRF